MTDAEDPAPRACLGDRPVARANKDSLADTAKPLALTIGWGHQGYGDVPQKELLAVMGEERSARTSSTYSRMGGGP